MRILVTGSRHWTDEHKIARCIAQVAFYYEQTHVTVVHGDAPGADACASRFANVGCSVFGLVCKEEKHPSDWQTFGAKAGPIRNSKMVSLGAEYCLAFPTKGSKGTWDCIRKAAEAGIPVCIFPEDKR